MGKINYLKLLDSINQDNEKEPTFHKNDRVLIVDGLNLFLRNFAMINFVNEAGTHTGGLGGFLRSLGSLINLTKPTTVYVIFDGIGGATNRKNLLPEYKSGRNVTRLTNWDIFGDIDSENQSKVDQIVRLIHYLKCLPIKVISLDKVEADDIIAFLSKKLVEKYNSKVTIVSADQDFTQLVTNKITHYRPVKKEFYTPDKVIQEYGIHPENFIIYKTLMGDSSDKVPGIKGLGKKGLLKKFPELADRKLSLQEIIDISARKYQEHIVYSRVVFEKENLEKNYKIMDLHNPLLDEDEKGFLEEFIEEPIEGLKIVPFLTLYREDGLNNTIKNPDFWLRDTFKILNSFK